MSPLKKNDLTLLQGRTFIHTVKWGLDSIVYKPITGITQAAPCIVTAIGHGLPDGWRVAVVSAKGLTQINASTPPKDNEYVVAKVLTPDTVELNTVNASGYKPYVSGGYLQYNAPKDLAGYVARMTIKDKVGGTELMSLTTANSRIQIDNTTKTITLAIDADDTAAITWKVGTYDLELESPSGVVTALMYGAVKVTKEVTT
jgi:tRNA threonylcarbamoyladenosine modification (KEOPS) complex  Pcc1 subunit